MATILGSIADFTDDEQITIGGTLDIMSSKHFNAALQKLIKLRIKPASTSLANVTDPYSKQSLECMLNNLECFSEILLAAFCDGHYIGEPSTTPPSRQIYHTSALTREFALNAVLQQTEIDANAISLVINDRIKGSTELGKLVKLDEIANNMIQSAVNGNMFDPQPSYVQETPFRTKDGIVPDTNGATREPRPMPLVHFSGASKTRMNPYCPVALISLPIDLINKDPDDAEQLDIWLKPALAYEVGRLIFWKGSFFEPERPAGQKFFFDRCKFSRYLGLEMQRQGFSKWIANAVSGIFADVFMTIQCGDNALGHAIRRAQPRKLDRFHGEDLRYQLPPLLRPYVSIETLKLLNPQLNLQTFLDQWKTLLDEWKKIEANIYGRTEITQSRTKFVADRKRDNSGNWDPIPNDISTEAPWKEHVIDAFTGKQLPPINVTVYTDSGPTTMSFEVAREEVERATKHIFKILSSLQPVSSTIQLDKIDLTNTATPHWNYGEWQNGQKWMERVPLWQEREDTTLVDTFFLEAWLNPLSIETRNNGIEWAYFEGIIDKATFDANYRDQRFVWGSALYAGGWTMESPGNAGNPY